MGSEVGLVGMWGIHSKTPGGCLRPQMAPNPVYALLFPMHTYPQYIYKSGKVRD